jgi:protein O-GlcNAc transferase
MYSYTHLGIGRLGKYVDKWVNVWGLMGGQAAKIISDDQIDILVELTGHTAHNRCGR